MNKRTIETTRPQNIYSPRDVNWQRDALPIDGLDLPLHEVATTPEGQKVYIAYFDPRVDEVLTYGSQSISTLLAKLNPSLVIQPASDKSEPMVNDALLETMTTTGIDIPSFTLLGGTDLTTITNELAKENVPENEWSDWYETYTPITGKKKYIGLTPNMLAGMAAIGLENACLVDDVYSSGATVTAIRKLLARLSNKVDLQESLPAVVVAIEYEPPYDDQHRIANNVLASAAIPVVTR